MIAMRTAGQRTPPRPKSPDRHRFPRTPVLTAALLAVSITALIRSLHGFLDLQVYRVNVQAWLHDGALYGPARQVRGHLDLPFTYPPSAALQMIPLAVMPAWLAELLVTTSSLACLAVTLWLIMSRVRPDLRIRTRVALTAAAAVGLLALEPVRLTLWFGQINLVLMAAVALDCLTEKPRWPRGLLVGVAAVTKLTPTAFVLYFLIRRDWKAAGTAVATSAAILLTGFVLFPHASRRYWFDAVIDTRRIGPPSYVGNQSIKGMLYRLGLPNSTAVALWLGLALVVLGIGAVFMHRLSAVERADAARTAGAPGPGLPAVTALLVNAAVVLLISPVSWTHHWVWVGPALLTVVARKNTHRSLGFAAVIAGFVTVFLIGPGLLASWCHHRHTWPWWQQIPGGVYVIATAGLIIVGLVELLRPRGTAPVAAVSAHS